MLFVAVVVAVYGAPTFVALKRVHHQTGPIVIVNLFLGWTLVGWVVALAWAVSPVRHVEREPVTPPPPERT